MKQAIFIILLLAAPVFGFSQNLNDLLQNTERNNPRLSALQKWLEAEETRARTGIYPDNPDVSYKYLFGNEEAIGNQQEFEVMQSLKLPGYYSSKSDLQQLQFEQKKVLVQKERLTILHEVRTIYFDLTWLTKKAELLEIRKNESEKLVKLMKKGLDAGEISKPVYDKARIFDINVQAEWQKVVSDIQIQKEQLKQLSGEMPVDNLKLEYPSDWGLQPLDTLFSVLSIQNPDLVIAQLGTDEYEMQVKHEKMNQLPTFEAGYHGEKILNQKLQGIQAGIEIPLWKDKNRVKIAKIQSEWSQVNLRQKESEVRTEVISRYNEIQNLRNTYLQMKAIAEDEQVSESSLQLLQSGQISFPEYLMEAQFIWDAKSAYLETEKNYFVALSKLKQLFL
jgi:outer membrane protein TolC